MIGWLAGIFASLVSLIRGWFTPKALPPAPPPDRTKLDQKLGDIRHEADERRADPSPKKMNEAIVRGKKPWPPRF